MSTQESRSAPASQPGEKAGAPGNPLAPEQERRHVTHTLARLVLGAFVFTFIIARVLVIFIMSGKLPPELFFHVAGTHVHHLNYGIILLSAVGAFLIINYVPS